MLVQKSEAVRAVDLSGGCRFPAPGDYLYIHVDSGRGGQANTILPRPNMNIRASLESGDHQQWIGRNRPWFRELKSISGVGQVPAGGRDLGIETEAVALRFRRALKVTSVSPNSPAAQAGIEVGDVLVTANGADVTSPAELAEQVRTTGSTLKLTVRDVRTDKNVPVEVDLGGQGGVMRDARSTANRSSGMTTEVAFLSGNTVLKVTDVGSGTPAQRAGIQPGLLILSANGNQVDKPEDLVSLERNSRGTLELKLFDPKSRKESTVQLNLR